MACCSPSTYSTTIILESDRLPILITENQTSNSEQTKSELENGNQYAAQICRLFLSPCFCYTWFFFFWLCLLQSYKFNFCSLNMIFVLYYYYFFFTPQTKDDDLRMKAERQNVIGKHICTWSETFVYDKIIDPKTPRRNYIFLLTIKFANIAALWE